MSRDREERRPLQFHFHAVNQQATKLQDLFHGWLRQQEVEAPFYKRGLTGIGFDALVVKPIPVAFEFFLPSDSPLSTFRRFKRNLSRRLALAEEVGRYVPLIVVVPDWSEVPKEEFVFVDGVFRVSELPPIHELPSLVRLDPITQAIIERGDPGEVSFTTEEEYSQRWTDTVSLFQLTENDDFPDGSFASRITQRRDQLLRRVRSGEVREKQSQSSVTQLPLLDAPAEEQPAPAERDSQELQEHRRRNWLTRRAIDEEVEEGLQLIGATHYEHRIPLSTQVSRRLPTTRLVYWTMPNGKNVVIRDAIGSRWITSEYAIEAMIIRALSPVPISAFVMVLGQGITPQENALAGRREPLRLPQESGVYIVNALEGAGWIVFPWDFAKSEPEFIQYLRSMGNE